jgi:hypothetical protein
MMALSGLRPLKETNTLGNSPAHNALLNGAYDIYVQDQYANAAANTTYYAAKWIKLAAGDYQIRFIIDDVGTLKLNGTQIATGTNGGDWVTPVVQTFSVATSDTYRLDLTYTNVPGGSPSFICYEISTGGKVVEVSRANDFIGDTKQIPDSALGPKPPYNEDLRLSYPVFLPKPDWKSGVLERLEWLTDVLQSESGAEQRRCLREYPRRSLEASFASFGDNRGLIDSFLSGVGPRFCLVPLWWDETPMGDVYAGSIDVFGDFYRREFFANDVVMIRRAGVLDYELNIIAEKTDTKLTLLYGIQKDTTGATISPVRVAQVRDQIGSTQLTDAVRQYQLRFFTIEAADYTTAWTFPIYSRTNLPVLNWEPNYKEQMDLTFDRVTYSWDNQVGNPYIVDPGATATTNEKYGYTIYGRAAMHDFKTNIYKMAGRWREMHVPTGHDEFVLTRDIDAAQGALIVSRSGYNQYNLSQQAIRRDILIELYDGSKLFNTIISSRVVEDEEWLFLSETIASVPKAQVRRISYMPRSRLDIDSIEINRLTDADGASKVALTFKAIVERRNAPPIPIQ